MKRFFLREAVALFGLVSVAVQVQGAERGLAWATDDRWATVFANSAISWYHHWQLPKVTQMASNIEFVPMNWGPKYAANWEKRIVQMNAVKPKHILAFNEPDVPTQANMTPLDAAEAFVLELEPWRQVGVLVSSPQIVWNITWMDEFMKELRARGSDVDFMAIHYYGSWNDLSTPKKYIANVGSRYGKKVWVTELGTTLASAGTNNQVRSFMNSMTSWADTQSYIERIAWTGSFAVTSPPDYFINNQDAMFFSNGTLRKIGREYKAATAASTSSVTSMTSMTSMTLPTATPASTSASLTSTSVSKSSSTSPSSTPTTGMCKRRLRVNKGNVARLNS